MIKLGYASPSARCHASSPRERPPASGRKSYCVAGKARKSLSVFSASRPHAFRNISSSLVDMVNLLWLTYNMLPSLSDSFIHKTILILLLDPILAVRFPSPSALTTRRARPCFAGYLPSGCQAFDADAPLGWPVTVSTSSSRLRTYWPHIVKKPP